MMKKKSPKLCDRCQKNAKSEPQTIKFEHDSRTFTAFKIGGCCSDCVKKEIIGRYEKVKAKLFSGKKVNWEYFINTCEFYKEEEPTQVLIIIGVFSRKPLNNWEIVADGPIGLNPRQFLTYCYFQQKEDAIKYAKLKYVNSLYFWEIRHIDQVISKEDAVK